MMTAFETRLGSIRDVNLIDKETAKALVDKMAELVENREYRAGCFLLLDNNGKYTWESFGRTEKEFLWVMRRWEFKMMLKAEQDNPDDPEAS